MSPVFCICHSALDAESSILYVSGFPLPATCYPPTRAQALQVQASRAKASRE